MPELPTGTVAFLMSDIEGSTRLVRELDEAFPRLLDEHNAILDDAVRTNGGTFVSSEGDSVFAVFPSVRQATTAAITAQRVLAEHGWPNDAQVRVRMGIHAGEAVLGGRGYTGIDVHRTARIMAAGHGGQVLISEAARALAGGDGGEVSYRDLGSHVLRDLPDEQHLFQLLAPGLVAEFGPLRTETPGARTNLPAELTRFVGRERELVELGATLATERLVTLTGLGGTGKTRLAVETGRSLLGRYTNGVWFVALEAVRDPALVLPTVASTLGVPARPGRPVAAALADHFAAGPQLLVLDNLEQVIESAREIGELLRVTATLTVLASSREPLAIEGERVYPVPPMSLPKEPGVPTAADIIGLESVVLFVDRARAARPDFELTDAVAPTVAAICRRLDGLPLALELAAARMNVLAPEQILSRLDHRLDLLASSRRDLPDRQRTLRGAMDWSHELLEEPERILFRRFSVFAGGASLEAIEAVVDHDHGFIQAAIDVLGALVDRSLVYSVRESPEPRFGMLETIREYAAERLADSGEATEVRARHAGWFKDLAMAARDVLIDPRRDEMLDRLERELGNLRAVIAWSLETGNHDLGFELATGLQDFWHTRNHLVDGGRALDDLLAASVEEGTTRLRTWAMVTAGELAGWQGDYRREVALAEQAASGAETLGERGLLGAARSNIGWGTIDSMPDYARANFETAVAIAREQSQMEQLMGSLQGLSIAQIRLGDYATARLRVEESIEVAEARGNRYIQAMSLLVLGIIERHDGNPDNAVKLFTRALRQAHEAGGNVGVAASLEQIARVLVERDPATATMLASAAARLRRESGSALSVTLAGGDEPLEMARRVMASEEMERASAAGAVLTTDEAVALALRSVDSEGAGVP